MILTASKRLSLFVSFFVLSLAGCGEDFRDLPQPGVGDGDPPAETGEDPSDPVGDGDSSDNADPEPITEVAMQAAKHYGPSRWENDVVLLNGEELTFLIPAQLQVVSGNAGNHLSMLHFDDVECRYKGGASQSKPLKTGDPNQIALGQLYHLEYCEDASGRRNDLVANSLIDAETSLELRVDNGDSTESTVISVTVAVSSDDS